MTTSTSQSTPPLRLLFWESTSRCNLACVHCRRQDVADAAAREDLATGEVKRLIESVASLRDGASAGPCIFVFSGGEPLMRPDWRELAEFARSRGLITALATNGTMIDAPLAGQIAVAGFHRVSVSLDGADSATHDRFRGVAGAFERAMTGIAALRQAGVSVQINATIARHNIHQLDELYALARRLGAVALHLFLLVPVGCGVQIEDSHQLPSEQYERVLNWICDRQEELLSRGEGFELKATCAPHYYRIAAQRKLLQGRGRGCLCGISVAFVSHRGQVFPCGYLPIDCGNVREREFAEIWRTSEVFADMRQYSKLGGKCGRCEFRGLCGGCRARAYAMTQDYLAEEPFCGYQPRG